MANGLGYGGDEVPRAFARDLEAGIKAEGGQEVAKHFVEETSLKMALESQANSKIHRHTEITLDQAGTSDIVDRIDAKAPSQLRSYVDFALNNETMSSIFSGFIDSKSGAAKDNSQLDILMDPSHNQTFILKDDDSNVILNAYGSCLSNGDKTDKCDLSISGTVEARVDGSRTWLTSDHTKTHFVLHPTEDTKTNLGSMDIETQLIGKKIIMDVDITKD